ncbi:MAG TPA: ABC transporter permease, partial [Candidatus Bathyarchaeota archaeon]|nr:ABC transporter permease [Candidatus Bathyarchaeota archaeon]
CYSFMGLLFSAIPSEIPADAAMLSRAVRLPLGCISGIFIPIQNLPEYLKPLAFISPLTYFSDLINNTYSHNSMFAPIIDIIALFSLTVVFAITALTLNKRTLAKRL